MKAILYTIATVFLLVIIAGIIIFIIRRRLKRKGNFSHSLGLGLLKITLPPAIKSDKEKISLQELREKIAVMEQVYSQLAAIQESSFHTFFYGKPFFVFELAVPRIGSELLFYCAVPRRYLKAVEKIIIGLYPDAQVEETKEYNIFHPAAFAAGALARGKNKFLPIKTYQNLEADPLGSIANAFSKVAKEGEGMGLQILAYKTASNFNERLLKISRHLREGKNVSEAIKDSLKSSATVETEKKKRGQLPRGPLSEPIVQAVERKASKALFEANIRLVTAASTQERADALLEELIAPFSQFNFEEVNNLNIKPEKGRWRQKIIYFFSFRLPESANTTVLSTEELASIIHFPNTALGAPHIASLKAKTAPAPANLPAAGLLLGQNIYRRTATPVYMSEIDRARHLYIVGQTGTGKTYFMKQLVIQDILAGKGVCFIDPHGDAVEDILGYIPASRVPDVIYFNPGDISRPLGLNMLEYDERFPEQKTFIINELLEIFNKLYDMKTVGGPMFEQYFRNATALVLDDPSSGNTLIEINRVLSDRSFRAMKLAKTASPLVKTFWRDIAEKAGGEASLQNIVPYISSKFDSFLSNEIMRPIVAQEKSAFRLREVMDNKRILLINLSKGRLGELNSSLIGLIMIGKILMAAFSRVDVPEEKRTPFYLYIDEFQNVTTNTISTILSEARKYKLNLTLAHQFIGQLAEEIKKSVFGNVGSKAAFRVGAEDGEFLEKEFGPTFTAFDLVNIDNFNCYVKLLINGQTAAPFSLLSIYKPEKGSTEIAAKAKEFSRLTYGRDRSEVEAEIRKKFESLPKPPAQTPINIPPSSPLTKP